MKNEVFVLDRINVPVNSQVALTFLQDLKNIDKYEPKVDKADVKNETGKKGTYEVKGKFAGIPWTGKFFFELNEEGFYSEMLSGPLPGLKVQGGFKVKELNENEARIIHYENYQLPPWLAGIRPLLKLYLNRSIKKELEDVKALILDSACKKQKAVAV